MIKWTAVLIFCFILLSLYRFLLRWFFFFFFNLYFAFLDSCMYSLPFIRSVCWVFLIMLVPVITVSLVTIFLPVNQRPGLQLCDLFVNCIPKLTNSSLTCDGSISTALFLLRSLSQFFNVLLWGICHSSLLYYYEGSVTQLHEGYIQYKPVYSYELGLFCMPTFLAFELPKKYMIIGISKHVLWFVCVPVWNMPMSDFWWYIGKSCDLLLL